LHTPIDDIWKSTKGTQEMLKKNPKYCNFYHSFAQIVETLNTKNLSSYKKKITNITLLRYCQLDNSIESKNGPNLLTVT